MEPPHFDLREADLCCCLESLGIVEVEEGEGSRIVEMGFEVSHSLRRTVMGLSSHLDFVAVEKKRSCCMSVELDDMAVVEFGCGKHGKKS